MTSESRGLGKGLEALLGAKPRAALPPAGIDTGTLPVASIQAGPSQPRRSIEAQPLEELAASIKANGVIQPIVVRPKAATTRGDAEYEIVAGERRWQAAKLAGLIHIPAVVRHLTDREAVAVALIENIQREELTAVDEARALKRLATDFSLTHQAVADAVGRSRASVSNLIRLLELPDSVLNFIDSKALSMGHARALLGLEEDHERTRLAKLVVERGLSVRETENLVRKSIEGEGGGKAKKPMELTVVTQIFRTESVQAQLHQRRSGRGKIIIDFNEAHGRDAILELLRLFEE